MPMVVTKIPAAMAEVMTPEILAPMATGRITAKGFSSWAACWASLAVVGTQETPAMPDGGVKVLALGFVHQIHEPAAQQAAHFTAQ